MAGGDRECGMTETKKVIINPRVEIDTSPPFESVKEAVDHFGGGGPWIPHHLLPLSNQQNGSEISDIDKVEKQAAQLEKDLIIKEQETLNVLKEVEAAKRFVEGIKLSFIQEMSALMASPDLVRQQGGGGGQNSSCPSVSPGLISMELDHAKLSLNKTATNLAAIRASVESLNHKMRDESEKEKCSTKNTDFCKLMPAQEDYRSFQLMNNVHESPVLNYEAEQFKKMTEASRYEVMRAMAEIERTKTSIKMAEMRLTAARKMEEAAKAVEAIALVEMDNADNSPHQHMFFRNSGGNGITLSIEEYNSLTHRAHQADQELCKTKFIDRFDTTDQNYQSKVKNMEEATNRRSKKSLEEALVHEDEYDRRNGVRNSSGRFRFRNSSSGHRRADPMNGEEMNEGKDKVYRSTISIGDILSRKLILQEDDSVEGSAERQAEVSLSQMLREQSGLIMHHPGSVKPAKEASLDKQFYTQRKKFGFIHVTFPRHSKKKSQFL